jgi:hypothetical protein
MGQPPSQRANHIAIETMLIAPSTPHDPVAEQLAGLAAAVRRLRLDWHDPERFYEERSEIAGALLTLSRRLASTPRMPRRIDMPIAAPRVTVPRPAAFAAMTLHLRHSTSSGSDPCRRLRRFRRHRYPMPPCLSVEVQPRLAV